LISKVPIVVKPSTAHYPKQHLFVKKTENPEGEGSPAPESPSLSHSHYGNNTGLGAAGQFVTFRLVWEFEAQFGHGHYEFRFLWQCGT